MHFPTVLKFSLKCALIRATCANLNIYMDDPPYIGPSQHFFPLKPTPYLYSLGGPHTKIYFLQKTEKVKMGLFRFFAKNTNLYGSPPKEKRYGVGFKGKNVGKVQYRGGRPYIALLKGRRFQVSTCGPY